MSMINIRIAEESDAHAIATIHVNSWQKIYRGHIPDTILDKLSIYEREQQWRELIRNQVKILVIEKDTLIVGFASLCPSRDADSDHKKCGEISAIYLDPAIWHQGLGKKLCNKALSELSNMGFSEVILWVLIENKQARQFYESIGFTNTGDIKADKYSNDVILNEIRYHKKLQEKLSFKPLRESDLNLLCQWLNKSHVKEWWDDGLTDDKIKEKYGKRIGNSIVCPYIAYLNDKPIGFIQYYWASKVGDGWWPNEDENTVGLDQFIGEEDYINKGFGTLMIKEFIQFLFQNPLIKKIITEADPNNLRAKRCYEKAGFHEIGIIDTPDGKSVLMTKLKETEPLLITEALVSDLIAAQFPQWKNLPIRSVTHQGWDNRTFHLGEHMLVRLPSNTHYAAQVEKEQHWLPKLAPLLPLSIPVPLEMGKPNKDYPWHWSIYRYLPGKSAASTQISNLNDFAISLAQFLIAFQHIDPTGAPLAGEHSFYRGGALKIYDAETRQAIASLKGKINETVATEIWETAIATTWTKPPVWVHGDISAGNLLIQNGKLSAVIDFGQLAVGDPACDLAIAWTFFKDENREAFRSALSLDEDTWARGRGWTLWKALITAAGFTNPNNFESIKCLAIINELITEHENKN